MEKLYISELLQSNITNYNKKKIDMKIITIIPSPLLSLFSARPGNL